MIISESGMRFKLLIRLIGSLTRHVVSHSTSNITKHWYYSRYFNQGTPRSFYRRHSNCLQAENITISVDGVGTQLIIYDVAKFYKEIIT